MNATTPDVISRTTHLLVWTGLLSLCLAPGCRGCFGCGAQPTTSQDAADAPPDTRQIDMEKAREQADKRAVALAVDVTDSARFLASEIEGASTEIKTDLEGPPSDPSGQIDSEALRKVFNEHRSEMQQCYERALKTSPDLAGRVILEVDIGPGGTASRVAATGETLQSEQVNTCLERTARDWSYPEPTGGTARVRKPFSFSPKQ